MSTFDDASLVFIPSGYKTSKAYSVKPSDGSGDLTFSRSNDTATRVVLSDSGQPLIEKVRTNLYPSNIGAFVGYTLGPNASDGGQVAGPTGAMNARRIIMSATGNAYMNYTFTVPAAGTYTFSFYARTQSGTPLNRPLIIGGVDNVYMNALPTSSWTRIYGTFTTALSGAQVLVFPFYDSVATIDYSQIQWETGDIATDYIATTSSAVSVGPVANVPRLDYLGSSCPRLLLEPQRTNLAVYSEQFDNAAWTKSLCTISANASTSPDGYSNSDRITASAGTGFAQMYSAFSASAGAYTYSFFVKAGTHSQVFFGSYGTSAFGGAFTYRDMIFDIATGTITASAGNLSVSTQINNYGNGWYRVAVTYSATANGTVTYILGLAKDTTTITGTWAGTENILGYGIQVEAGAYATSYIPTLGAAVTRGADACSKTGISSLIGSTAGTIFLDATFNTGSSNADVFQLDGAGTGTFVLFLAAASGNINLYLNTTTTVRTIKTGNNRGQRHKIAISYQSGSLIAYVDGVQTLSTTYTIEPDLADLYLNTNDVGSNKENTILSQLILFKSVLSPADLAALTTI